MSLLQLKGISKRYGFTTALGKVGFEIGSHQIIGLVGESGCGKTTLGRIIVGLESLDEGELIFDGKSLDYSADHELRPQVQFIFQNALASFNPRRRIGESIAMPLREFGIVKGQAEIEIKVLELISSVGLEGELANRYPHELSGGQIQRAAFARAIASNPKLLVADEPTSALDASLRAQVLDLIRLLRERMGLSCIVITHDLPSLRSLADQVHVMRQGDIIESGPPLDILQNPTHPYTRRLISAIPSLDPSDRTFERFREHRDF
ncbi:MAG: ATP-binding cassette domain-containing protein [Candidatus Caenarcaniphilales bacterium]|nr:ATP-binding cassette domain-containing protein [Candidatus Caenarcaniphilales bacterium]